VLLVIFPIAINALAKEYVIIVLDHLFHQMEDFNVFFVSALVHLVILMVSVLVVLLLIV